MPKSLGLWIAVSDLVFRFAIVVNALFLFNSWNCTNPHVASMCSLLDSSGPLLTQFPSWCQHVNGRPGRARSRCIDPQNSWQETNTDLDPQSHCGSNLGWNKPFTPGHAHTCMTFILAAHGPARLAFLKQFMHNEHVSF